jgi:phosphoribosylformylglycinamidine cyclo-ligase
VLPDGVGAVVDASSWTWPPVFRWLAEHGPIEPAEMWRTFNCGVGMVLVVAPAAVDTTLATLAARDVDAWVLGHVEDDAAQPFRLA